MVSFADMCCIHYEECQMQMICVAHGGNVVYKNVGSQIDVGSD